MEASHACKQHQTREKIKRKVLVKFETTPSIGSVFKSFSSALDITMVKL